MKVWNARHSIPIQKQKKTSKKNKGKRGSSSFLVSLYIPCFLTLLFEEKFKLSRVLKRAGHAI